MKTFELTYEQVDTILIDELQEAFEINRGDSNLALRKALLEVLNYYMEPRAYDNFIEQHKDAIDENQTN
jgi:hypothetical protein